MINRDFLHFNNHLQLETIDFWQIYWWTQVLSYSYWRPLKDGLTSNFSLSFKKANSIIFHWKPRPNIKWSSLSQSPCVKEDSICWTTEWGRPNRVGSPTEDPNQPAGTKEQRNIESRRALGYLGHPYPLGTLTRTASPSRTCIFCTFRDIDTSLALGPVILIRT